MSHSKLAVQSALITGAGSGLGRALALHYADQGWQVVCADQNEERNAETAEMVSARGAQVMTFTMDICSREQWAHMLDEVSSRFGGIGVLINNAGVASAGELSKTSWEDFKWTMDIDLEGLVNGCHLAVPFMISQGYGHIVNVASFAALAQAPGMVAYNVAKAGVVALSESLRGELYRHGIGVTVVCPAFFKTNLTETLRAPNKTSKQWIESVMESSGVAAEDVARDTFNAMRKGKFMVISHRSARNQYRMKRFFPNHYFRSMMKKMAKIAKDARKMQSAG